ncbi:MAG TPA: LamG-like jellyroll fold domain-containing protein, partial [Verrucomicrobiae bacterium]|nr:LamG-like jellyroll fold domain-containing protein [Verrucomicrobiae bacterium]
KRSLVSGGPYTNLVLSAPLNCCLDSAVTNGATYYYVISAVNATGESANSVEVRVTTPPPVVSPPLVLTTWFKADALGLANGAAVSTWLDSSGNGDNATQANTSQMPTFVTGAMNGLPVVRFTSASQTYLGFSRPVSGDFTIICVFQSTQGLNSGTLYYQGAGLVNGEVAGVVSDFGTCLFANGAICAGTGNPDVAVNSSAGYNDGAPHIMTFTRQRSTGGLALYVDGVLAGTTNGGLENLTAPAQLVLGAQQTLLNFLSGDIAEVKIYNAVLSPGDRTADESSLRCKYGLGTGSPPAPPAGLTANAGNRQVQLTWNPVVGAGSYSVFWSSNGAGTYALRTSGLTATNFVDLNALNGRTNYYQVIAVSSCGAGTNAATASVFLPLPTLGISRGQTSLNVSWPSWASDWLLYSATNLTPPASWSHVTNVTTSSNGQISVTLPINSGISFFRLFSP